MGEVGQIWKGKFHHKVIKLLEDQGDKWLVELQISSGGGKQWLLGKETLAKSYKLLEEPETTLEGSQLFGAAKLNP